VSNAFGYDNGYDPEDSLLNGVGYWLKFSGADTVSITGVKIATDTFDVDIGWNLIGSVSRPIRLGHDSGRA
jgi:hypothetical protein